MEIIVGIDVSKDRLDVHLVPSDESFFVDNSHAGIDALASQIANMNVDAVALEAVLSQSFE